MARWMLNILFLCVFVPVLIIGDSDEPIKDEQEPGEVKPEVLEYAKGSLCGYCDYCKVRPLNIAQEVYAQTRLNNMHVSSSDWLMQCLATLIKNIGFNILEEKESIISFQEKKWKRPCLSKLRSISIFFFFGGGGGGGGGGTPTVLLLIIAGEPITARHNSVTHNFSNSSFQVQ